VQPAASRSLIKAPSILGQCSSPKKDVLQTTLVDAPILMRDLILPEIMFELMDQVPTATLDAVGTIGEVGITVMDDALGPNGFQMVPEWLNIPDVEVNQLFFDCRSSGNPRSWLGGNGHLHRSTALLEAGLDLCGIRQDGFSGYLIVERNGFGFCRDLLPDPFS